MFLSSVTSSRVYPRLAMPNRVMFRSVSNTWCSITLVLLMLVVCNAAIGYKKFLKGLILGAMLMKQNSQDEHHYFYPVYHGHSSYDDHGHY